MAASFTIGIEKGYCIFGEQIIAEMSQSTLEINSNIMPDIPTTRKEAFSALKAVKA